MKKKKVFILFASPNKDGNTAILLRHFLKDYSEHDIIIFNVYDKKVRPCIDCGYCKVNDCCRYNDFDEINKYLNIADILVVATPAYNLSFPAPLKAVFDRTQIYFVRRFFKGIYPPIKKEKEAILLLTTGSNSKLSRDIITEQLNMIFCKTIEKMSVFFVDNNSLKENILLEIMKNSDVFENVKINIYPNNGYIDLNIDIIKFPNSKKITFYISKDNLKFYAEDQTSKEEFLKEFGLIEI